MNCKGFGRWGWLVSVVALLSLLVAAATAEAGTINGTVTNNTSRTGRVYLYLQQGNDTGLGVSVPVPAPNTPFTIRGVPNGTYTLKAFVDGSGTGRLHAKDPTWNSQGIIDINNNSYSGPNSTVTFSSLPSVSPQQPGGAMIIPGDNGAFVGWQEPQDSNGNSKADAYRVYYSTSNSNPKAGGVYVTVPAGDQTFAVFHYANGTPLYVQVTALIGTTESTGTPPVASTTINPPAAGFSISGTIDLSGIANPTGNLSVALIDMSEDGGGPVAVAHVTSSPQLSNNFTINTNSANVPNGTYALLALLDMNGDGRIGSGDVMPNEQQAPTVTVNGANLTGQTITLTRSNSSQFLNTTHWQDTNTPPNESYQIVVGARSNVETLANITITSGPGTSELSYPIDLGINSWGEFQSWFNVNNNRPQLTDIYNLNIQYANGAVGPDTVNLPVTAVLDSFATPTAPVGNLPYSAMVTPSVYTWTAAASPPTSYTYSFWTNANGFNNNSNEYQDMSSATTSLSISGLSYNYEQQYNWNINVQDAAGNQAQKSAWFVYTNKPAITSFTPTTVLPGMTLTINGSNFSPTPANNTVYFGCGASAQATTASATQLQVVVPQNACSGSLQVNNGNYSSTQLNIPYPITISGQVTVNNTYNGIPGATVTVNSVLLTKSTLTDPYGNYNLSGVPSNTDFTLKFTAAGYEPAYTGTINTNSSYMIQNMALFSAGTFTAWNGGNLTTGVIRGRVFEQSMGSGITGVAISASAGTVMYDNGSGNTPVAGSATGANGVFYIKLAPDSTSVTINATKTGYLFNPVYAVGHALGITNVDVPGFPLISISGTIVNSSNAPLAGADIQQEGTSNEVTSNAGGAFTINNIPGGTSFELKMSLDPTYMPVYSGWINTSTSLTLPYAYVLFTPAEFSVGLGIAPGKGAIVGRVVNSNNPAAAISGATVTAYGWSPSYTIRYYDSGTGLFSSTTSTDASGLFLVRDVEDGANINISVAGGANFYGYTNVTTHANAVTEIAVPCNVPWPSWGNLQSPGSLTVMTAQTTPDIYGRVYLGGITDMAPGPAPGLVAELGYGPQGSAPGSPSWVWKTAAYSSQTGIYYEYATNLSVTTAGNYDYVYRYSYFGGQYSYGDLNGPVYGLPYYPGRLTVTAPIPTATTVVSNLNPSGYGQGVTFTASVEPAAAAGAIQFFDGAVSLGTVPVSVGSASLPISDFSVGTHSITAVYSGDASYSGSTSSPLQQSVNDRVMIGSIGNFLTLQAAIDTAVTSDVLLMRDTRFAEDLVVNRTLPFTITMKGGLASNFSTPAATATTVRSLRIRLGKIIANRLVVKPN